MTRRDPEFKRGARGRNDYCASQGLEADTNVMKADNYAHREHAKGCAKYRSQFNEFWRKGVGRRACQGKGEASCEGSRMGSEVAIMAWARALIPFFGVDVPASKRDRERRVYSQNTKKAKKADAIPWLTVHASGLKLPEVTMCEVGCCRARFLQGGWGLHKKWPKMIKARQQEQDAKTRVDETQA